jgi:hypothetical protein
VKLSVVIPTYDPRPHFLERVVRALGKQTLPVSEWELLIVDNASPTPPSVDLSWHPAGRMVSEQQLGLTRARIRGFSEAQGDVVVLVDDDNVLDPDYLATAAEIAFKYPFIGTWSGNITLEFEDPSARPPEVYFQFLTTRRAPSVCWSNDPSHNDSTPWGAGLCIRRSVFETYAARVREDQRLTRLDLQGKNLVYGGDTDIAFTGCAMGLGKGVFPSLHITHLIPPQRCEIANLLRSAEGQAYSQVLHGYLTTGVLSKHRDDFLGRVGGMIRYLRGSRDDRLLISARKRGEARALREFSQFAPKP